MSICQTIGMTFCGFFLLSFLHPPTPFFMLLNCYVCFCIGQSIIFFKEIRGFFFSNSVRIMLCCYGVKFSIVFVTQTSNWTLYIFPPHLRYHGVMSYCQYVELSICQSVKWCCVEWYKNVVLPRLCGGRNTHSCDDI